MLIWPEGFQNMDWDTQLAMAKSTPERWTP
jgi:hypothetical protein